MEPLPYFYKCHKIPLLKIPWFCDIKTFIYGFLKVVCARKFWGHLSKFLLLARQRFLKTAFPCSLLPPIFYFKTFFCFLKINFTKRLVLPILVMERFFGDQLNKSDCFAHFCHKRTFIIYCFVVYAFSQCKDLILVSTT